MPVITINYRSLVAFAAGLSLALIAVFAFHTWSADAAPGDTDTTFVPIAPCRLADTRPAPDRVGVNGAFGVDDTRTLAARGANGNCTIPDDAVGLALNVTAVDATTLTFLTFWPDGERPLASSLNPAPGEPPRPNAVNTDLSDTGSFNLYNLAGSVNVIIDINGYYTNTSLRSLASRLADAESRLAGLELGQPFAVMSSSAQSNLVSAAESVLSLELTAPVAGSVTINSHATIEEDDAASRTLCSINDTTAYNGTFGQVWEQDLDPVNATFGEVSGTRTFQIGAGQHATYYLICLNVGTVDIQFVQMTAIFTPD
jgi:hypothetical protein